MILCSQPQYVCAEQWSSRQVKRLLRFLTRYAARRCFQLGDLKLTQICYTQPELSGCINHLDGFVTRDAEPGP